MVKIQILDLAPEQHPDSATCLRTLQGCESSDVRGGLDPDSGGLTIIGLGVSAAFVGSATAPLVAAAGITIGLGILFRKLL